MRFSAAALRLMRFFFEEALRAAPLTPMLPRADAAADITTA